MAINGDDAIDLFKDDAVVETFGTINTDVTGKAWDYLEGWAYRLSRTGFNRTFVIAGWSFSGINQLEGVQLIIVQLLLFLLVLNLLLQHL